MIDNNENDNEIRNVSQVLWTRSSELTKVGATDYGGNDKSKGTF